MTDDFFDYDAMEKDHEPEQMVTLYLCLALLVVSFWGSILFGLGYIIYILL